jgi:hypothetical protein
MDKISENTCIQFKKYEMDSEAGTQFLPIYADAAEVSAEECGSSLGFQGGEQNDLHLDLPEFCFKKVEIIIKYLFRALGVGWYQQRWDRDKYVSIYWEHITRS